MIRRSAYTVTRVAAQRSKCVPHLTSLWGKEAAHPADVPPLQRHIFLQEGFKSFSTTAYKMTPAAASNKAKESQVHVEQTRPLNPSLDLNQKSLKDDGTGPTKQGLGEIKAACGTLPSKEEEEEDEMEEMFVDPHKTFEHTTKEWGGPRRGGRFKEPTRYGDWERKGRCTDF